MCAGNPHARFDRAGAGNGLTAKTKRARSWKRRTQPSQRLRSTAPVPDPTIPLFVRARFARDARRSIQTYFRTDALYCAYAVPKTDETPVSLHRREGLYTHVARTYVNATISPLDRLKAEPDKE